MKLLFKIKGRKWQEAGENVWWYVYNSRLSPDGIRVMEPTNLVHVIKHIEFWLGNWKGKNLWEGIIFM